MFFKNSSRVLSSTQTWIIDSAFLAGFILMTYLLWLGSYPLFNPDEGRYMSAAQDMIATGDFITPRINGVPFLEKPILYYWFQALAIGFFGTKEWTARLFPVLFGLIGGLTTYFCGRRLFNRRTGLLSALILVSSPLYFSSAHYANLDLEIAVLISCTLLFFITGINASSKARFYFFFLAYITTGLAFLTKGLIGIAFPIMIVGSWVIIFSRWKILKKIYLLPGIILIFIMVLPWCLLAQKENPDFIHYFFITQHVSRFLSVGIFNNPAPFWFYLPIILLGFFPWSIFLIQAIWQQSLRCWHDIKNQETTLFLLLWSAIIFIFFSIPHSKIITYQLPIFPALSLLVGRYLDNVWDKTYQKGIRFGNLIFVVGGMTFALIVFIYLQLNLVDFSSEFLPYLTVITFLFMLAVSASLLLMVIKKDTLPIVFLTYISFIILTLLTVVQGAKYLNQNSTKSLVVTLKTLLKPTDEVVNFYTYYYDMPFYLGKNVTVVADWHSPKISKRDNWLRELSFNFSMPRKNNLLIDEPTFWTRWNGPKRLFVFVDNKNLYQLTSHTKTYYLLGTSYDINLLSNQPDLT